MEAQTANWDGRSIEKGAEIYANNCYTCHGPEGKGGTGPALHSRYFFEHRLEEIGFAGTLEDYVKLTVAAGRPSNSHDQWLVVMPTWSATYGGPLRHDQVEHVTNYVLNWESTALLQTPEEDPWIPFVGVPMVGSEGMTETVPAMGQEGPRTPEQVFSNSPVGAGCEACHNPNLPQDADNRGPVGPNLGNLAVNAASRVPGQDAATYVRNSIINPNEYVVEGYQAGIMLQGLHELMSEEELDALIAWLIDPNRVAQ
jgi:cytochrome c2